MKHTLTGVSSADRLACSCPEGSFSQKLPDEHHGVRPHSVAGTVHLPVWCGTPLFRGCILLTLVLAEPPASNAKAVSDPQGTVPKAFSFALSQVKATTLNGGSVKIVDSTTFPISTTIAAAEVTVEPGAIRELHVSVINPNSALALLLTYDSGILPKTSGATSCQFNFTDMGIMHLRTFFSEGQGRVTVFASSSNARTFDYQPGDIGYVPASFGTISTNAS